MKWLELASWLIVEVSVMLFTGQENYSKILFWKRELDSHLSISVFKLCLLRCVSLIHTLWAHNNDCFLYHTFTMNKVCDRVISILTILGGTYSYYFHFTGEETEAQQG